MFCAIWYHLYNLKSVKNTHGGVLLLVKFTKSKLLPLSLYVLLNTSVIALSVPGSYRH